VSFRVFFNARVWFWALCPWDWPYGVGRTFNIYWITEAEGTPENLAWQSCWPCWYLRVAGMA
jgi:hypothetical protein